MSHRLSRGVRSFVTACVFLVLAAIAAEIGLRIKDDYDAASLATIDPTEQLTVPCWRAVRSLRPLAERETLDPDRGVRVKIQINSFGFRGIDPTLPKPPGTYRVLLLGDETVFGTHLAREDTVAARLERLLAEQTDLNVEVLNAAVPGDCPLLSCLRLKSSFLGFDPDLIIQHFDISDIAETGDCRRRTRLDESGHAVACPASGLCSQRGKLWFEELRVTEEVTQLLTGLLDGGQTGEDEERFIGLSWPEEPADSDELRLNRALAPLEELKYLAEGSYANFLVATCPQPWQVSPTASDGPSVRTTAGVRSGQVYRSRVVYELLGGFAEEHGITYCNAVPYFEQYSAPDSLYFKNAVGLSPRGAELYARVLAKHIFEQSPYVWNRRQGGTSLQPASRPIRQPDAMRN